MLAEARRQLPPDGTRPWEWTAEQKTDGFRAILFARSGQVLLQSRRGNDLSPAFPDIAAEALRLGESLVLDGEFVVPHSGRLDFAALQSRARRRGPDAARAAEHLPACLIVFDVLEADPVPWPYSESCSRQGAGEPCRLMGVGRLCRGLRAGMRGVGGAPHLRFRVRL